MPQGANTVGVVVIGRNEGERLVACLRSLAGRPEAVVYVDSCSTDGSAERAAELGATVVSLDPSAPMSAARARNVGLERLLELDASLPYVQFIDGDCEVQGGWIEAARRFLDGNPDFAVVCGRRQERVRDATPYNRLADMEWDTPVGEALACGGDAMIRVTAVRQAGGYDPSLIAGEDPELCLRIRLAGGRIMRLDEAMTLHDAAMTRFGQWWKRASRAGHAFAESAARHFRTPERYCVRQVVSILAWGLVLPGASLVLLWPTGGASLLLLSAYGLLWWRIQRSRLGHGDSAADARLYASACVVGKFAEATGVLQYAWNHWVRRRRSELIEYKGI
jgi:GT2 family glycosyltransferase